MCAEKDPLTCHRTILVAHYARPRFAKIRHILTDGSVETGTQADARLMRETGLDNEDLFTSSKDRLQEAYRQRGEQIAYEAKG